MTCIYDSRNKEIQTFSSIEVSVEYPSRILKSPIETGQVSFDDKVLDPKKVHVTGYIEKSGDIAATTIGKISTMYYERSLKLFKVMNDDIAIENLFLESFKHSNDADNPDLYKVDIDYTEALLIQSSGKKGKSSSYGNSSSTGRV